MIEKERRKAKVNRLFLFKIDGEKKNYRVVVWSKHETTEGRSLHFVRV